MKNLTRITLVTAALFIAQSAIAHDPKEHEKEAAAAKAGPDCASMKDMDMSKMDMNDPVMKAMHDKCMSKPMPAGDMKGMKMDAPKTTDDHGGH
ncbi:hypothetical protein [Hydrocarboniphaga sp.]|uniref:hypothetical protein n=1 Tax=Hydrocarboniphaga sp. TaxID=2033016 RepID=UPI003451A40F